MFVIRSHKYSWWQHHEMSKCAQVQIPLPTQFQPGNLTSKCCLDQNWYWQPWLAQDSAKKSAEFPTYPDILGPDGIQGGVDFPANVVHFELVCSNHKFRICQIAIVKCSIKVCIQQMLHGLKKQYRSVLTKVQESYHFLIITFYYQTTGLSRTF